VYWYTLYLKLTHPHQALPSAVTLTVGPRGGPETRTRVYASAGGFGGVTQPPAALCSRDYQIALMAFEQPQTYPSAAPPSRDTVMAYL
jgi:hypothetical protein